MDNKTFYYCETTKVILLVVHNMSYEIVENGCYIFQNVSFFVIFVLITYLNIIEKKKSENEIKS